jgi:endonuclease/exonuclease/phosphatase family metal-dependent hydrolase
LASPAIVAGDFNIGKSDYRRNMITAGEGVLPGSKDALRTAITEGLQSPDQPAAEAIVASGKDWMFERSGGFTGLTLERVTVPFGLEANGRSLSDHFGYVAYYRVD